MGCRTLLPLLLYHPYLFLQFLFSKQFLLEQSLNLGQKIILLILARAALLLQNHYLHRLHLRFHRQKRNILSIIFLPSIDHNLLQSTYLHPQSLHFLHAFPHSLLLLRLIVQNLHIFAFGDGVSPELKSIINHLCLLADQHAPQIHHSFLVTSDYLLEICLLLHLDLSVK